MQITLRASCGRNLNQFAHFVALKGVLNVVIEKRAAGGNGKSSVIDLQIFLKYFRLASGVAAHTVKMLQ